VFHRRFDGKIKTVTISKTPTDKYFVSILVETQMNPTKPKFNSFIGIDLGVKTFATFSNGIKIDNPKFLNSLLKRIKNQQKFLSKKTKGSNNYGKARLKLAKLYESLTNSRNDFLHKLSSAIVYENQGIVVEDLAIQKLLQGSYRNLSRAIADCSWGTFLNQLEYKSKWNGRVFVKIDRYEPSSKTCSSCQVVNNNLQLGDREWTCSNCGRRHDRDINAAINVLKFGLGQIEKKGRDCPDSLESEGECKTLSFAMKEEALSFS